MKKIIAIILAAACIFAFASCDESGNGGDGEFENPIEAIVAMYALSEPTKIVTAYTTQVGNVTLSGEETLVTGSIDGKIATVYEYWFEELTGIDEGGGETIFDVKKVVSGSKEYLEDQGVRENGGSWKKNEYNFAPVKGDIAINITEALVADVSYSGNTLMFTVPEANIESVFGIDAGFEGDVKVSITNDGAVITGIVIEYTIPGESDDDDVVYPDSVVTISTAYTYDLEVVSLIKH